MNIEEINILIIEDNPDDANLIGIYLKEINDKYNHAKISWKHSENLAKGIAEIEKGGIDLVLLDLSLPDSFALNSLEKLKDRMFFIPLIIMTGLDDEMIGMEAIKNGAQDYLIKGKFDIDSLYRSIRYSRERHRMSCELRDLSLKDSLTGLYNRRGLMTLCEQNLKIARRNRCAIAGIYIDINKMKSINDTFGHGEGDNTILGVSQIMKSSFRESDIIARLGGDEFFVFTIIDAGSDFKTLLERFEVNLDLFNKTRKKPYVISCSIGSYTCGSDELCSVEELIKKSDELMYKNKTMHQ